MKHLDLVDLLCRVLTCDPSAADDLDELAARIQETARQVRNKSLKTSKNACDNDTMNDPGGMTDRIQINVVGPDGNIKQRVDTK